MADSKLSALGAVSALASADTFYVVQSGTSLKFTGVQLKSFFTDNIQTWALPQRGSWGDDNDGTIVLAAKQNIVITPTGNITMSLPADIGTSIGQSGLLYISPGAHTVSWAAGWSFPDGVAPTLTPSVANMIPYIVGDAGTVIHCGNPVTSVTLT